MNLRYFERRTEVVRAYVRAENGCEETNHFVKRPYVAAKVAEGRLPDTWREVVGDAVANLTTDLRLENRILYVRLQSSVVRQELFYQREALRDRINEVSKVRLVNAVIVK